MDGRKAARPGQGRDAYYKNEWSKVLAENATLKQQLDELSRENHQLKNSLYTISLRHEGALESLAQSGKRQPSGSAGAAGGAASSRRGVEGHEPTDSMSVATSSDSEVRFAATAVDLKGHAGAVYAVQFSPCGACPGTVSDTAPAPLLADVLLS
jgi:COMPASS component SWD3|eukprot:COSAG01_NODE_323_length_18848_cov_144.375273_2_plen_154_part_00